LNTARVDEFASIDSPLMVLAAIPSTRNNCIFQDTKKRHDYTKKVQMNV
jgi:hypothetical protein